MLELGMYMPLVKPCPPTKPTAEILSYKRAKQPQFAPHISNE